MPLEVADLEDEIAGLNTRIENIDLDIKNYNQDIAGYKTKIKSFEDLQKKYKTQLNSVKNNREFEALSKEIEIAELEVLGAEKRIKETSSYIEEKNNLKLEVQEQIDSRNKDLDFKKKELKQIVSDTESEEKELNKEKSSIQKNVDERLLKAYLRIRSNVKNGIGVAPILRASCGGCFSKIPPQRQSDIKQHFKIIDCEHCGRILVDNAVTGIVSEKPVEEEKPKRRVRTLKKA